MNLIKKLIIILLLIVAIVGIGLTLFGSKIDGLIAEQIEDQGSAAIGTKVTVGGVTTDIAAGRATIKGLTIANPDGYEAINAIEIAHFSAAVNYASRSIEQVIIDKPIINAELKGRRSNFQDLKENIPGVETSSVDSDPDSSNLTIKKLLVRSAQINLIVRGTDIVEDNGDVQTFTMDDMELTNLSGTPQQVANEIAQRLSLHISSQVKNHFADQLKERATQEFKEKASAFKDKLRSKLRDRLKTKENTEDR